MTTADAEYCQAIAYRICASWGALHLLEDAEQEACIAFFLAERKFDPAKGRDMGYANLRIAGAVHDFLRSETKLRRGDMARYQFVSIDVDEGESLLPAVAPQAADGIDAEVFMRRLDNRPRWKEVVTRRFWGGETQAEVGDAMGVNSTRASQIEHLALNRMRECAAARVVGIPAQFRYA